MSARRRPDAGLRVHSVTVRLAADELLVLDRRRQTMRRADYLRHALLDRLPVFVPQANQSLWAAHGRIGQNLNQMMRSVHLGQVQNCPPELLAELIVLVAAYRNSLIGLK